MLMLDHDPPSWWTLEISVTGFISSSSASAAAAPTSAFQSVATARSRRPFALQTNQEAGNARALV